MTESTENIAVHTPEEQEDSNKVTEETPLTEVFEKTLDISQDVGSSGGAASVETDSREKPELEDTQQDRQKDRQQDGQNDRQHDGQRDRQQDGQTVSPPAAEPSCTESKDWRSGYRCRAMYSGDGLVYPAVILWVKGQRCCVRYDDYNNEEEQDVSSLLNINELHRPIRATAAKCGRKMSVSSRREDRPGDRGAERKSVWRDEQHNSWVKERPSYQNKAEKEEKKKDGEKPTNPSFPFFPPFPPYQSNSGDSLSFTPPPPPPSAWAVGGKETAGVDSASNMLMLWYMCGFHTGNFLAQQAFKSGSKD
ncbi:survival motor neuron protein-like isoform X2 [Notolabrus celidotus]|uniref:survival motor neuron protein-like isoform X2 n=1 Tax=Notolabrus celidotus TaxID=1203425 RepID=UPI00148F4A37|nr:survival motor neuron protein-like isoform X2 [Notolabrus celidotus]